MSRQSYGYRVTGQNILVEEIAVEETTKGGLYWAGAKDDAQTLFGTVLAVGDAVTGVTAGDVVAYAKFAGTTVKLTIKSALVDVPPKDVELLVIRDTDILMVQE